MDSDILNQNFGTLLQNNEFRTALEEEKIIEPVAGQFLFFSPTLNHEVTKHESIEPRISIAFNVGPVNVEEAG